MPAFDHCAPVPIAETLPANTISQHRLDLFDIGVSNNIIVLKHLDGLFGIIVIVSPAFTGSESIKLLDNLIVFRQGQGENIIFVLGSTAPSSDWSKPFRIQTRQKRDQLLNSLLGIGLIRR